MWMWASSRSDPSLLYLTILEALPLGALLTVASAGMAFFVQWLVRNKPMLEPGSDQRMESTPSGRRMSLARCVFHYVMIYGCVTLMLATIPWDRHHLFPTTIFDVIRDAAFSLVMLLLIDLVFYGYHRVSHEIATMYRHSHFEHHLETNPRSVRDSTLAHWFDWLMTIILDIWPLSVFPQTMLSFVFLATWLPMQAQFNHCGRRTHTIPMVMSPAQHYAHHRHHRVNFAEHTTVWDALFGTLMGHEAVITELDHRMPPTLIGLPEMFATSVAHTLAFLAKLEAAVGRLHGHRPQPSKSVPPLTPSPPATKAK